MLRGSSQRSAMEGSVFTRNINVSYVTFARRSTPRPHATKFTARKSALSRTVQIPGAGGAAVAIESTERLKSHNMCLKNSFP